MRSLLLSCLLLAVLSAAAKENYIDYHREIIHCEEQFLYQNDIKLALRSYRQVFDKYRHPFAKDCLTALQLAASIKDRDGATYFFGKAFDAGVDIAVAERSVWIGNLLQEDANYSTQIAKLYEQKHKAYLRTLNMPLRNAIISMKNMDDSMKMRCQGLPRESEVRLQRHAAYIELLKANVLTLVAMVKKHGFPGDRVVGLMDYAVEGADVKDYCYSLRSLADQLFVHHSCSYLMLQDELLQAVRYGTMQPAMYGTIYEWAYKDINEGREELTLCKPVGTTQQAHYNICPVIPPWQRYTDTVLVNKCRAEIGMTSLQHQQAKEVYEKEHNMRLLYGMFNCY